jgi:septal ring factor EnvC (AmiA/AmiB activator)
MKSYYSFLVASLVLVVLGLSAIMTTSPVAFHVMAQEEGEEGAAAAAVTPECNCQAECESMVAEAINDSEQSKAQVMAAVSDITAKMDRIVAEKADTDEWARNMEGELKGKIDELTLQLQQMTSAGETLKKMNDELTEQKSALERKVTEVTNDAKAKVESMAAELAEKTESAEKCTKARFYVNFELLKSDCLSLISKAKAALGMKDEL